MGNIHTFGVMTALGKFTTTIVFDWWLNGLNTHWKRFDGTLHSFYRISYSNVCLLLNLDWSLHSRISIHFTRKKKLIIKRSSFYYSLCKWIDSFILEIFPFRMSLTRLTAYISTWVSKWYSIEIWSVCIFEIRVSFVFGVNTSFLCFFALTIGLMQTEIDTFCDAKLRWYRLKGKGGLFVYDISKERHVIFFNKNWIGHNAWQIA